MMAMMEADLKAITSINCENELIVSHEIKVIAQ